MEEETNGKTASRRARAGGVRRIASSDHAVGSRIPLLAFQKIGALIRRLFGD